MPKLHLPQKHVARILLHGVLNRQNTSSQWHCATIIIIHDCICCMNNHHRNVSSKTKQNLSTFQLQGQGVLKRRSETLRACASAQNALVAMKHTAHACNDDRMSLSRITSCKPPLFAILMPNKGHKPQEIHPKPLPKAQVLSP